MKSLMNSQPQSLTIKKVKEEAGLKEMKVVATGGLGSIIANATDMIDEYDRRLTMKGLEIIYKKNCRA